MLKLTLGHAAEYDVARTSRMRRVVGLCCLIGVAGGLSPARADDTLETGRQLFLNTTPACAICHTLEDAGSSGAIGPVLDEIQPDAARVEQALRNGIGQMPAYTMLSDEDIKTLAAYVAKASRQ